MEIKNLKEFKNLIGFLILMENTGGVCGKSPDYVLEKFSLTNPANLARVHLDHWHKEVYDKYMEHWGDHIDSMFGEKDGDKTG